MRPLAARMKNVLPYRRPREGRDYWVVENVLAQPLEVTARARARTDWSLGAPYRAETWPGMRAPGALTPSELARLEEQVRRLTGARALEQRPSPEGGAVSNNHLQVVGAAESGPRPHVDSLRLCSLAAVIYLTPQPPQGRGGTAFYRLRLPGGLLGGNTVSPPHANLVDALGTRRLPLDAWAPELELENRFNRLVLYKSDLVHSAASYFGRTLAEKRMTALFFWMAKLLLLVAWGLSLLVGAPRVRTARRVGSRSTVRMAQRPGRRGALVGQGWLQETTAPRARRAPRHRRAARLAPRRHARPECSGATREEDETGRNGLPLPDVRVRCLQPDDHGKPPLSPSP